MPSETHWLCKVRGRRAVHRYSLRKLENQRQSSVCYRTHFNCIIVDKMWSLWLQGRFWSLEDLEESVVWGCIYKNPYHTSTIVIYLDFHSTKRALWLVDSWSFAPDQIQMYPDRHPIPQFLPAPDVLLRLLKENSKYITKHLMSGPAGNQLVLFPLESRCFPRLYLGKHQDSRENKTNCFLRDHTLSVHCWTASVCTQRVEWWGKEGGGGRAGCRVEGWWLDFEKAGSCLHL